jgi:phospholipid-binding lipoprotein MlaA
MKKLTALLGLLLLSACSSAPATDDPFEAQDHIKPFNEAMFSFNLAADEYVIAPVAHGYHHLPDWTRGGIGNFLTNLSEPANVVNGVLQFDFQSAGTSLWRFLMNSTIGFAGLRDFAGENGLKYQDQDFGKTLGSYGVSEGSYVVLPLAGPSDVRDTAGLVVDWFIDPVGWYMTLPESIGQAVADGITTRDDQDAVVNQFYYESLEPYSATRAAYLQHEAFQ